MIRSLIFALAIGCGGGISGIDGPPAAQLGTGVDAFTALTDGGSIAIQTGTQGGHHLWGAARAANMTPNVTLTFTLTLDDEDGAEADAAPISVRHDHVGMISSVNSSATENWKEHLGSAIFLDDPTTVQAKRCRLHLDIDDQDGRHAESEAIVVPQ